MNAVAKRAMATGNNVASWLYRRTNGRLGGSVRGLPVLLLTVAGRRTGRPRSVPIAYFEHENGYLVAATAGGAKTNPQWILNLGVARQAHLQIGEEQFDAGARLIEGGERDQLWQDVVVAQAPHFAKYTDKSGRTIPLAHLVPHS
jgi:deazaflavin-dependent oxidoreductase (nitroreductase family)